MSPRVAPESVEPYWATRASTFCPTEKRSGRCSPRSRASSERLMKVVRSLPTIFTSRPASFTSITSQVTTEPFLRSPALSMGSSASCLMPSEMRSFSTSTSSTLALTLSPFLYSSITCSPGRFQSRSERWTMPSTSPSRPRNSPNSVLFLTSPSSTAPGGYFSTKTSHGLHGLLEPERDAPLDRIDLEDLHLHLLGGGHDLAGMHVLLGPRHLGHVDEALDAGLELHERAVIGDVGDAALEARADGVFRLDALPRIVLQLLHAERDAVGLVVDLDDLDLHLLADIEHLGGVIDAPPGDVGDVQKPVDAAEIDECAVVRDVLDHAVDDLTFFEILHQLLALFGARLFEHRAARHHDVAAAAIHFQDLERLRLIL